MSSRISAIKAAIKHRLPRGIGEAVRLLVHELRILWQHSRGVRKSRQYTHSSGLKLNIGCGPNIKPGWVNIDLGPNVDLTLDMRRSIPLPTGSASCIYSEHFFEHLENPPSVQTFLLEAYRLLESGGLFSVGVPDTEWIIRDYNGLPYKEHKPGEWLKFVKGGLHPDCCYTPLDHINFHFRQFTEHKYAYDYVTLAHVLEQAGFTDIRQRDFDPSLDAQSRKIGTLYVDARKPGTMASNRR
jgi:predicted SAM-dependent methyltransferase